MWPTLTQEIANVTATWNFRFAYDPAGSHTNWNDQVSGTINDFLKGLSTSWGTLITTSGTIRPT